MKALRTVGTLCLVTLSAEALSLTWYRSGLGDLVWILTIGHDLEGYPNLADADYVVVTLVSVLISAALVRRMLPAEFWRMNALRVAGALCFVVLFTHALLSVWFYTSLGESVRVWVTEVVRDGRPEISDMEFVPVMLVGVLTSSAIVQRFFRWRPGA